MSFVVVAPEYQDRVRGSYVSVGSSSRPISSPPASRRIQMTLRGPGSFWMSLVSSRRFHRGGTSRNYPLVANEKIGNLGDLFHRPHRELHGQRATRITYFLIFRE